MAESSKVQIQHQGKLTRRLDRHWNMLPREMINALCLSMFEAFG